MRDRWGIDGTTLVMVAACACGFYGFLHALNERTRGIPGDVTWGALWGATGVLLALLAIFLRLGKMDRD
jgi:hypothetical protein